MNETNNNGIAVTGFVLGICALVLAFLPGINFLLAIGGLVCSIIGLNKAKKLNNKNKGLAVAGIIVSGLGLLIAPLTIIGMLAYFGVLSPTHLMPERTIFKAPLMNIDNAYISSDGVIAIPFRNSVGNNISITGVVNGDQDCANVEFKQVLVDGKVASEDSIANGDVFILEVDCGSFKKGDEVNTDISFEYLDSTTGMKHMHSGSIMGKAYE